MFPSLFKITDKIHISFGIFEHQGHTKIIIITNIAIAIIILNNKTIISNMMMVMNKTRRIYQRKPSDHHHPHNLLFWITFSSPKSAFSTTNWENVDFSRRSSATPISLIIFVMTVCQIYKSS